MSNVLDLQGLQVADFTETYCPSSKSVIIIVTPFHLA